MLGTLVVDEIPLLIDRITLGDGCFLVWVDLRDVKVSLPERSEFRLHDPDGTLVAVGPWRADQPYSTRRGRLTICQPIKIDEVAGWPR